MDAVLSCSAIAVNRLVFVEYEECARVVVVGVEERAAAAMVVAAAKGLVEEGGLGRAVVVRARARARAVAAKVAAKVAAAAAARARARAVAAKVVAAVGRPPEGSRQTSSECQLRHFRH